MVRKSQKIDQPDTWEQVLDRLSTYKQNCKHRRDYAKNRAIMVICVVQPEISITSLLSLKISDYLDETEIIQSLDWTCFEELSNYVYGAHPTPKERDASLFGFRNVCNVTNMMFNIIGCSTNKIKALYHNYLQTKAPTCE